MQKSVWTAWRGSNVASEPQPQSQSPHSRSARTHVLLVANAIALVGLVAGCSRSTAERPSAPLSRASTSGSTDPRTGTSASPRVYAEGQPIPKGGGVYKIGSPYKIAGRWYFPAEDPGYDRSGIASWYGADFHGRKTANGETYDMNALSAAHPTLPIPSYAYVTSIKTGRTVLVRINDRGPYAADRILDMSRRSAESLGLTTAGISEVRVKYAGRAPLSGDDSYERRFLASQPWSRDSVASRAPSPGFSGRMGVMN